MSRVASLETDEQPRLPSAASEEEVKKLLEKKKVEFEGPLYVIDTWVVMGKLKGLEATISCWVCGVQGNRAIMDDPVVRRCLEKWDSATLEVFFEDYPCYLFGDFKNKDGEYLSEYLLEKGWARIASPHPRLAEVVQKEAWRPSRPAVAFPARVRRPSVNGVYIEVMELPDWERTKHPELQEWFEKERVEVGCEVFFALNSIVLATYTVKQGNRHPFEMKVLDEIAQCVGLETICVVDTAWWNVKDFKELEISKEDQSHLRGSLLFGPSPMLPDGLQKAAKHPVTLDGKQHTSLAVALLLLEDEKGRPCCEALLPEAFVCPRPIDLIACLQAEEERIKQGKDEGSARMLRFWDRGLTEHHVLQHPYKMLFDKTRLPSLLSPAQGLLSGMSPMCCGAEPDGNLTDHTCDGLVWKVTLDVTIKLEHPSEVAAAADTGDSENEKDDFDDETGELLTDEKIEADEEKLGKELTYACKIEVIPIPDGATSENWRDLVRSTCPRVGAPSPNRSDQVAISEFVSLEKVQGRLYWLAKLKVNNEDIYERLPKPFPLANTGGMLRKLLPTLDERPCLYYSYRMRVVQLAKSYKKARFQLEKRLDLMSDLSLPDIPQMNTLCFDTFPLSTRMFSSHPEPTPQQIMKSADEKGKYTYVFSRGVLEQLLNILFLSLLPKRLDSTIQQRPARVGEKAHSFLRGYCLLRKRAGSDVVEVTKEKFLERPDREEVDKGRMRTVPARELQSLLVYRAMTEPITPSATGLRDGVVDSDPLPEPRFFPLADTRCLIPEEPAIKKEDGYHLVRTGVVMCGRLRGITDRYKLTKLYKEASRGRIYDFCDNKEYGPFAIGKGEEYKRSVDRNLLGMWLAMETQSHRFSTPVAGTMMFTMTQPVSRVDVIHYVHRESAFFRTVAQEVPEFTGDPSSLYQDAVWFLTELFDELINMHEPCEAVACQLMVEKGAPRGEVRLLYRDVSDEKENVLASFVQRASERTLRLVPTPTGLDVDQI